MLSALHVQREQCVVDVTQPTSVLDDFSMAPLAFEGEQRHDEARAAFGGHGAALFGELQRCGEAAVIDQQPRRKPGETILCVAVVELGIETTHPPRKLRIGQPRRQQPARCGAIHASSATRGQTASMPSA